MAAQNIPTDEVQRLASAGRSEKEIISTLRQQGYSNEQISKALNRVLKFTVGGDVPSGRGPPPPPGSRGRGGGRRDENPDFNRDMEPPPPGDFPDEGGMGRDFQVEQETEPYAPMEMEQLPSGQDVIEMTAEEEIALEELIEEIINEKWRDVEADLADLDRLYNASMDRMDKIERQIEESMQGHQSQRSDLEETLDETATQLQNLQGRVNSLERAFKEFLPELTDNIRELADVVSDIKEAEDSKPAKKSRNDEQKDEMQTDGGTEKAYCVKCKRKRSMKNTREERTKNDRLALKGECVKCGTKMSKFLKN